MISTKRVNSKQLSERSSIAGINYAPDFLHIFPARSIVIVQLLLLLYPHHEYTTNASRRPARFIAPQSRITIRNATCTKRTFSFGRLRDFTPIMNSPGVRCSLDSALLSRIPRSSARENHQDEFESASETVMNEHSREKRVLNYQQGNNNH